SLRGMFEVYRDMQTHAAKAAYARAFAAFQADCPAMPRGHQSPYSRIARSGVKVPGRYSDTADIGKTIAPILAQHGLAYDWEETEMLDGCYRAHLRIRHCEGHSERKSGPPVPMGKPVMRRDGTPAQAEHAHAAAIITVAQRLCLKAAFGLWSIDPDDEDAAAVQATVSEDQERTINDLLIAYADETSQAEADGVRARMVRAMAGPDASGLADIPADKFETICERLNSFLASARKADTA
ncbi:MAG: ERF family protein, partial [Phycisphaerae bacterium]